MVEVCGSNGGCGTGWVYEDGWVITAAHVLEGSEPQVSVDWGGITTSSVAELGYSWTVQLSQPSQYMGSDKYRDIAAVKLFDTGDLHPAPLPRRDIDSLGADEKLVLIGQNGGLPAEAKVGVLSESWAIARAEEVDGQIDVIQFDLVSVAGDSGGAFVDAYGRVVGIAQGRTQQVGGEALGLPLSEIEKVWERLKAGEQLNDDLANWMYYEFEQ